MRRKSPKATSKNKGRGGTSNAVSRRGGVPRKSHQKCECLHCSQYQAKFKPVVHPCPNFKRKKTTGMKTTRKIAAPKKVITSRWVVPPKYDSQLTFPPCRCLPPCDVQASREQSESEESASSRASSPARKQPETANRGEKERNLREEFYDAVEKQAQKTSAPSDVRSIQMSYSTTRTERCNEGHLTKRVTRAGIRREVREVGRTWLSSEKRQLRSQDDILTANLPRSVSQGVVGSDNSLSSAESRPSSAKAAESMSPESRNLRRSPGSAETVRSQSRSEQSLARRKLVRDSNKSADPNLKVSTSAVSFSLSQTAPISHREASPTRVSRVSQSSSKCRGVLKDPRSTPIRSNSAKLFLQEEQLRKLQETHDKSSSPDAADLDASKSSIQLQRARAYRKILSGADSSVNSEDPISNSRLAPSRQFMNICAQELAKRKLIARAKAAQEVDSTDLFGTESHYEVFAIEKKMNGCTWGIRAYRQV